LSKTTDILAALGQIKNGSRLIGFAAETNDHVANATEKLNNKNLDMIVVNDAEAFEADASEITIIDRAGRVEIFPLLSKSELAHKILDRIIGL
jgi:phosphopantothenoylcysteine decarboxylase / phosphopantothenate---cysteine ligase